MDVLTALGAKRVIYISCNSETLKKDLDYLIKKDNKVEKVVPFAMFPHTTHVESVVKLSK